MQENTDTQNPFEETIQSETESTLGSDFKIADFSKRVYAGILDGIFLGLVTTPVVLIFHAGTVFSGFNEYLGQYKYTFALSFLYFALFQSSKWQATPGKMLLKIKVIARNGDRIDFVQGILRYTLKSVSYFTLYIPTLMAMGDNERKTLHDLVSKTLVVDSETDS